MLDEDFILFPPPPGNVADSLYCGACYLVGRENRGGLIISEESRKNGVVLFEGFCAVKLPEKATDDAKKIWPREVKAQNGQTGKEKTY
jgi:hypothetical protein